MTMVCSFPRICRPAITTLELRCSIRRHANRASSWRSRAESPMGGTPSVRSISSKPEPASCRLFRSEFLRHLPHCLVDFLPFVFQLARGDGIHLALQKL